MSSSNEIPRVIDLADFVDYSTGSVVSKTLLNRKTWTLSLFSFDAGQGLSEHTAPFDALVQILDGSAVVTIDGEPITATTGQLVTMPADIPHSLHAKERFKMLLIMVRA